MDDDKMIRKGDFLIIAIRCEDEEECHQEIAFADAMNGMCAWLREQSELRGIERKEARDA